MTNFTEARDEICNVVAGSWNGPILWDNLNYDTTSVLSDRETWIRVSIRHNGGGQETLADYRGAALWSRSGNVIIQIFVWFGTGSKALDPALEKITGAFEGYSGNVRFRNVRANEIGMDGAWFQTNVIAAFEYEELK